jgi:ABC transporter DrrB family efflux protein
MQFVWSTVLKDLRRKARDPLALALWLLVPFAILTLILLAFGSEEITPQAHLLIEDRDDSFISGVLLGAFGQGELAELIRVEKLESDDGRERVARGEGSGLLVIPAGFGEAVLNSQPMELELLTNPSQRILPGILEEVLTVFVDAAFYLQYLLGDELRQISGGPSDGASTFDPQLITGVTLTINQLAGRVASYIDPLIVELELAVEAEQGEEELPFSFGGLFFQSMFFMSLVFMAGGFADDFWQERRLGTLRRAVVTPQPIWKLLAGKFLATTILYAAIGALVLPVGYWLFGFGFQTLPLAILWIAFSGTMLYSIFVLIQLFASSHRGAGILSNLLVFPLLLIGGSFFPFESMPPWMAAIGRWAPNGWALEQLKAILTGDTAGIGGVFVALLALVAVLFLISAWRLEGSFAKAS